MEEVGTANLPILFCVANKKTLVLAHCRSLSENSRIPDGVSLRSPCELSLKPYFSKFSERQSLTVKVSALNL